MKKCVTFLVAILPILTLYTVGIASFADLALLVICGYHFLVTRKVNIAKAALPLILFVVYVIVIGLISAVVYSNFTVNISIRTARFVFYICCAAMVLEHLDVDFLIKTTRVIAIICFFAICVQYIAYYAAGKYVYWFIPGLSISNNEVYEDALETSAYFRPGALFGEPASLVWYILPVLNHTLSTMDKKATFKKVLLAFVLSTTIIMSKSLFGLLFLAVLWVIWVVHFVTFKKNVKLLNVVLFISLPILAVYLLQTSVVQEALVRIDFSNLEGSGSFAGRFLQYDIFNSLNFPQKIFGVGIGNLRGAEHINNTVAYVITGAGIIGIILLAVFYISMIIRTKNYAGKVLLLCTAVMCFGSNALISTGIVYFFSFVSVYNRKKETPKQIGNPVSEVRVR